MSEQARTKKVEFRKITDLGLDTPTPRECEVPHSIARGDTNREVADRFCLPAETVETHLSHVLGELQLSNRAELSRWAIDRRLD